MDKCLNNTDPTIEEVRIWGYDVTQYFIVQDEDLILHSPKYVLVLLELANDSNCPKNDYCLTILSYYSHIILASRNIDGIREIKRAALTVNKLNLKVEKWKTDFLYLSEIIETPREISESEASKIAFMLIVGDFSQRTFTEFGPLKSGFIKYMASTTSYQEYLYIDPKTAFWESSRWGQFRGVDFFE